jgi:hypothetical protein
MTLEAEKLDVSKSLPVSNLKLPSFPERESVKQDHKKPDSSHQVNFKVSTKTKTIRVCTQRMA